MRCPVYEGLLSRKFEHTPFKSAKGEGAVPYGDFARSSDLRKKYIFEFCHISESTVKDKCVFSHESLTECRAFHHLAHDRSIVFRGSMKWTNIVYVSIREYTFHRFEEVCFFLQGISFLLCRNIGALPYVDICGSQILILDRFWTCEPLSNNFLDI